MPINTATSRRVFLGNRTSPDGVAAQKRNTPTNDILKALFGVGSFMDQNLNGWAEQNISTMSLPADLQNKNVPVISQTIEQKAILADRFPTAVLAPITVVPASTDAVTWEELIFKAAIPGQVPERGRTRVARMTADSHTDTLRRYGLALEYNYGFFLYPNGLECKFSNPLLFFCYSHVENIHFLHTQWSQTNLYGVERRFSNWGTN